jgi:hypothetical protein
VCPEPEASSAEDVVTDRELADGGANRFDYACQLAASKLPDIRSQRPFQTGLRFSAKARGPSTKSSDA